jgi:hypothetical protein
MDPEALRAEAARALLQLRVRTGLQIAVCGATMVWTMMLTRPLSGAVVVTPPAAFAIAVALGREQAVRQRWAAAERPEEQLAFLRRFVEEVYQRRRRLRMVGPFWAALAIAALRFVDLGAAEALRDGILVVTAAMVAVSVYAFVSVPRLAALRARLAQAR